jgi:hypothetical protein
MKGETTNKKIDEVMHSANGITRATPRPFLFTRLEARMKIEKSMWWKIAAYVTRPTVAFACICFVIIINALVIFFADRSSSNYASQQGTELAAADEYSQVSTALYDFENTKP